MSTILDLLVVNISRLSGTGKMFDYQKNLGLHITHIKYSTKEAPDQFLHAFCYDFR